MTEIATESIKVKPSTKAMLDALGSKNESYDDVIRRLAEAKKK